MTELRVSEDAVDDFASGAAPWMSRQEARGFLEAFAPTAVPVDGELVVGEPHPCRLVVRGRLTVAVLPPHPVPFELLAARPHVAACLLAERARRGRSPAARLVAPMDELSQKLRALRSALDPGVGALDLWSAYELLSRRETSPNGRKNTKWLADELADELVASYRETSHRVARRWGKSGAVALWSRLARAYGGTFKEPMYRSAAALLAQGEDEFELTLEGLRRVSLTRGETEDDEVDPSPLSKLDLVKSSAVEILCRCGFILVGSAPRFLRRLEDGVFAKIHADGAVTLGVSGTQAKRLQRLDLEALESALVRGFPKEVRL